MCSASGTTRFVVTMEGVEPGYEEAEEVEEDDRQQLKGGMTERCKFWPNCKNGDTCPYHHPTIPCR